MAIQFNFRASSVTASLPAADNVILCQGGTTIFVSGPAADPISDAENRVRFVVTGSAPNGDFCGTLLTIRTRHRFLFRPTENGRLTASTFFTPSLLFALTCAGEGGLFELFDKAGPASLNVFTRMSVTVTAQNLTTVFNSPGANHNRFHRSLEGISAPNSATGGFAPELMDVIETRSFPTIVETTDQIIVDARYVVQAFANDVSTFLVNAGDGLGLNVPMAVIRTDP
jgi:hypothetical protein